MPAKPQILDLESKTERALVRAIANSPKTAMQRAKAILSAKGSLPDKFKSITESPLSNMGKSASHQIFLDALFSRDPARVTNALKKIGITKPSEQTKVKHMLDLIDADMARLIATAISEEMDAHESAPANPTANNHRY